MMPDHEAGDVPPATSTGQMAMLALHGAGRDEHDLQEFCRTVAAGVPVIAPRGEVRSGSGYSFFQRRSDHGIDAAALVDLAGAWHSRHSGGLLPTDRRLVLVGYSSGAIFAEALLATMPDRFAAAILLRPEPLARDFLFPPLARRPILLLAGRDDDRRAPEAAATLAAQLVAAGASVTFHVLEAGHGWAAEDEDARLSQSWLQGQSIG